MLMTDTLKADSLPPAAADFTAIKSRQQATWASGDFSRVAALIVYPAEQLLEAVNPQAGWRTLDVATGSGNAALAAARRLCRATGVDYVPALLERGRLRAAAEHLDVQFVEGDAEKLPFPDASFDAVTSIYGTMFAPDHRKTAMEMVRVCKPGGTIGLASWTPAGFIGELFKLVGRFIPPNPALTSPAKWGDEAYLRAIFAPAVQSITSTRRDMVFRFASSEEDVSFFRAYYGPTLKAFEALPPEKRAEMEKEMVALNYRFDKNGGQGGPVAIAAEYLETVIVRS
jgi:ubiquinone/menaquinone biosynthesis C-methylase UbiE